MERSLFTLLREKFEVCDYNPQCFTSLCWIIDDVIMDSFINAAHIERIKFKNNFFSKIQDSNILLYKGSIKGYMWKMATHYSI